MTTVTPTQSDAAVPGAPPPPDPTTVDTDAFKSGSQDLALNTPPKALDDSPAFPVDEASPLDRPDLIAQRPNQFLDVIAPDALVFGETHLNIPGTGGRFSGGNFGLVSLEDGSRTYFGAKPIPGIPKLEFGPVSLGASVVGSNNVNGDEAGIGLSGKVPTPGGDVLVFINARQDVATGGNAIDNIIGNPGSGQQTVSINFGAAYSVSDGSILALSTANPAMGIPAALAADLSGSDAWFGAAWRGTATFNDGELESINVSGQEIKGDQLRDFLSNAVRQQREQFPGGAR